MSTNQLGKLREIALRMPTEKQLAYLKSLGYEGTVFTKKEASELIDKLKKGEVND